MTPVNQTDSTKERGNCQQACIATLFNLELEQVPNFRLFNDDVWWKVFCGFIWGLGFEVIGYADDNRELTQTLDGYLMASIKTGYGDKYGHQIIIDVNGVIVHDPMPNNPCNGKNALKEKLLTDWYLITKRKSYL